MNLDLDQPLMSLGTGELTGFEALAASASRHAFPGGVHLGC